MKHCKTLLHQVYTLSLNHGEPMSRRQIATILGKRRSSVDRVVMEMVINRQMTEISGRRLCPITGNKTYMVQSVKGLTVEAPKSNPELILEHIVSREGDYTVRGISEALSLSYSIVSNALNALYQQKVIHYNGKVKSKFSNQIVNQYSYRKQLAPV